MLDAARSQLADLVLSFLADRPEMTFRIGVLTEAAQRVQDVIASALTERAEASLPSQRGGEPGRPSG